MRTPRGPSRSLWSLHRIASTSDVLVVTRRHTRVGIRYPPDVLAVSSRPLAGACAELTCEPEDPARPAGESRTGSSPRTPSIVSRTCKPKPADRPRRDLLESARTRTVSPSTHPRPASVELRTSFRLAPSRRHQQVLRPPGGEDARCVRSISATQTNRVYPHLARSRLALTAFTVGTPYGVLGSVGLTGGPSVSRHPRPLRRIVVDHGSRALGLTASGRERGRFLPTVVDAIEPLTPLSRSPRSPSRLRRLRACCHLAARPVPSFGGGGLARVGGWGGRRDHRPRRLVKADAS
jgi:hypothetical protein